MSRSLTNGLPIPAAPPRSPRKNEGPNPRPTSILPSLNEIDCAGELYADSSSSMNGTLNVLRVHLFS